MNGQIEIDEAKRIARELLDGFSWYETEKGYEYWEDVYNSLMDLQVKIKNAMDME